MKWRSETPIMLVVVILAARWIVRRPALPPTRPARLGVGLVALALLLGAEFGVVLGLRGLTIAEYFAGRDAVAGTAYAVMLVVFAVMPLVIAGRLCKIRPYGKLYIRPKADVQEMEITFYYVNRVSFICPKENHA